MAASANRAMKVPEIVRRVGFLFIIKTPGV